ncbi:MAG: NERD domain-containing protein [Actinomycetota bacterium]|nr:NERD domain-containing protein [Actinomycetota bacterium]
MTLDTDDQWARVQIDKTLVGRRAGKSAADKARKLSQEAPVRSVAARLRRVHIPERAWRKGASGERWTGWWLSRLPAGWFVFNDIPVGEGGANIDHLVVGPGGITTVNAKNLTGKVWVDPKTLRVNGLPHQLLAKGSQRSQAGLSHAVNNPWSPDGCQGVSGGDCRRDHDQGAAPERPRCLAPKPQGLAA